MCLQDKILKLFQRFSILWINQQSLLGESYCCIILGSNVFKQKTEQIYNMLDPIFMQHNMQMKFQTDEFYNFLDFFMSPIFVSCIVQQWHCSDSLLREIRKRRPKVWATSCIWGKIQISEIDNGAWLQHAPFVFCSWQILQLEFLAWC